MKNSIKRAQSRAGSSFAERENFRPKVKQLKKTILTLVALLAVTTGAWATDVITVTWNPSDIVPENPGDHSFTKDGITFTAATCDFQQLTFSGGGTFTTTRGNFTKIEISADYTGDVSGTGWSNDGWQSATWTGNAASVSFSGDIWGGGMTCEGGNLTIVFTIEESPAIKVAWDKDKKTGTFSMPGGNVTLEPEYYPQATVADGGVTAAEADARATTDDPLVKVDATKLTGAKKLMYFVSNSGTTAPAYDAEGWTDQLPTAESITQQGIVYVWYYPVGTDEGVDDATATYSDGDICLQSITARIAAAPTYAVTFADDLAEPTKWTASPNAGVTKGQTVTVTYTGSKKVIGVKAEKKAAVLTITVAKGSTDLSGDKLLYYTPGETYRQAIANHPENKLDGGLGWNIWDGGNDATIFYKESTDKSRDLSIDGDQHFRPTDSINLDTVIDPTLNFYFVAQF